MEGLIRIGGPRGLGVTRTGSRLRRLGTASVFTTLHRCARGGGIRVLGVIQA